MTVIRYDVPMVRQQYSPVCWLASATMVLQYKQRYTPSASRLRIRGPDYRTPGLTVETEAWASDSFFAYRQLAGMGFSLAKSIYLNRPLSAEKWPPLITGPSELMIYYVLRYHGPIVFIHFAGTFWYGPSFINQTFPRGSAHAVVITGVDMDRHIVYFNNPWGQKDVPTSSASIVNAMHRWERVAPYSMAFLPAL